MFNNFFKIAVRNLIKNKIYSFINIAGLAIGFLCFTLIFIFIKNELRYDTFHKNADQIYRPVEIQHEPGVGTQHVAVTMGPLAPALKNDFPEIINATRIYRLWNVFFKVGENGYYESGTCLVDPDMFDIFTIPFIKGDPATALDEPNNLVITQEIASKFFGDEDPIGKTITASYYWGQDEFTIKGVIENYPKDSHLNFTMLGSFGLLENRLSWMKSWYTNSMATYVLLKEGTNIEELEAKFPDFLRKYRTEEYAKDDLELYLQSLNDIHLYSNHIRYQTFNNRQGSINIIYTFSLIAIFIILIACINFMNLSTARSAKRAREVGIRKVLGSDKKNLIYQFLGESILISLLSLILAYFLVELVYPLFESILGDRIISSFYHELGFVAQLIGIAFVVGIISGSYPAFYLSSVLPVTTLKGSYTSSKSGAMLRKILVLVQFSIAIALIASTGIVMDQMRYIRNKNLGFNKEQIVYLKMNTNEARRKIPIIKTELLNNANILNVSATSGLSGASGSQGTMTAVNNDEEQKMMMRYSYVDFDYLSTMEVDLIEGRDFSGNFSSDTLSSVIINETAAREFGWERPIGKEFKGDEGEPNYKVIGLVKDYHFYSLRQKIEPLIIFINLRQAFYMVIKINTADIQSTMDYIEKTWNINLPDHPYDYEFLDEYFDKMYKSEADTGKLFGYFSLIAILIGCMGLFGLASFTVEQRTKEIGVRKVLGATVSNIIALLSKDFMKWVIMSSVIAYPVVYYFMKNWLNNFVYKTDIQIVTLFISGFIVVLIAFLTVSFQAIKAAMTNPAKTLRYE
jgi:putative ABC transport system permease protein